METKELKYIEHITIRLVDVSDENNTVVIDRLDYSDK
jgi:hypothetical protein